MARFNVILVIAWAFATTACTVLINPKQADPFAAQLVQPVVSTAVGPQSSL